MANAAGGTAGMVVVEGHQLCFKLRGGDLVVVVTPSPDALSVAAELTATLRACGDA